MGYSDIETDFFNPFKNFMEINEAVLEIQNEDGFINKIKAKKAWLNADKEIIRFIGDVKINYFINDDAYLLQTNELDLDLKIKSILSNEKAILKSNRFEISSSSFKTSNNYKTDNNISFSQGNFSHTPKDEKELPNYGKADHIEYSPNEGLILLKGNAEIVQKDMKILSDHILYNLRNGEIIESLNAKILNNS